MPYERELREHTDDAVLRRAHRAVRPVHEQRAVLRVEVRLRSPSRRLRCLRIVGRVRRRRRVRPRNIDVQGLALNASNGRPVRPRAPRFFGFTFVRCLLAPRNVRGWAQPMRIAATVRRATTSIVTKTCRYDACVRALPCAS